MTLRNIIFLLIALSLLFGACAAPLQESREDYVKSHPTIDPATKEAILKGEPKVGMTPEEVTATCGKPNVVTKGVKSGEYCDYWGYKRYTVTFGKEGKATDVKPEGGY